MNSAEEISRYKEPGSLYYSPTLNRRVIGYSYDFPEKSPKKEKKWTIGSLFRRKKKDESESSSDEEKKGGFLNRRKKRPDKRKKLLKSVGTFDHVVLPKGRNPSLYINGQEDSGILSDPTGGFSNYVGRVLPKIPTDKTEQPRHSKPSRESLEDLNTTHSKASLGSGSADSLNTKSRKEMTKARAMARRTVKNGSSSDEDSQRSASSSKFRSDDSLNNKTGRDSSLSRKSRAARTDRYLKRRSRDGENPKDYLRLSKSDAENSSTNWKCSDDSNRSPSRSPIMPPNGRIKVAQYSNSLSPQTKNLLGLSTIPPSHVSHSRFRVSNSTSNPSYKPPLSMNEYNNSSRKVVESMNSSNIPYDNYFNNQRSISCDANIHKAPSCELDPEILHVQLPIPKPQGRYRNLSLIDASQFHMAQRQPPPPPPRNPKRLTGQSVDNGRPNTYFFDTSNNQARSKSFNYPINDNRNSMQHTRKINSFNFHLNPTYRSTSEDHLPKDYNIQLVPRPSSTTPESNGPQRYITRHQSVVKNPENFQYLTDKKPRSRKPIFIQKQQPNIFSNNNQPNTNEKTNRKALDFWKQRDRQDSIRNLNKINARKSGSQSPQMFTSQTHVQTQVFLPSVLQQNVDENNTNQNKQSTQLLNSKLTKNNDTAKENASVSDIVSKEIMKRKSSNLEEALDELEAIYNSLRLGDEDLLERAEKREQESIAQKLLESKIEPYPNWTHSRGALSDSSFSYEPFDSVDSPRRKRMFRRSTLDRRADDMAYRKINKERAATINDPQSVMSNVSYLLASPVHGASAEEEILDAKKINNDEPDITLDDVVYRTVKHANNSLKVVEPQPPFGIPLGPITPGANSDYLHAVAEDIFKPTFKPTKIPDIVKDDLAYRNLRKDSHKEPALPPLSSDDFTNNNNTTAIEPPKLDYNNLRKRRAVRSLSANIGSLIDQDIIDRAITKGSVSQNNNTENKFNNLTDIADAMKIARQVLKEKETRIAATKRAFLSDNESSKPLKSLNYPSSSTETLTESRINFLNDLRCAGGEINTKRNTRNSRLGDNLINSKPPRGLTPERQVSRSPKESTPIPLSPMEDKSSSVMSSSQRSSLEDLLTAMADEARETSERITNELKQLEAQRYKKSQILTNVEKQDVNSKMSSEKIKRNSFESERSSVNLENSKNTQSSKTNLDKELNKKLSEIDAVSQHAKLCEKLLENVVDSNEFIHSTRSLAEEVKSIDSQPKLLQSVANIVLSREDSNNKKIDKISSEQGHSESEHDYENLVSDKELNVDEIQFKEGKITIHDTKSKSPYEENKSNLISTFKQLKVEDESKTNSSKGNDESKNAVESIESNSQSDRKDDRVTGETCAGVVETPALTNKECAFNVFPYNKNNTRNCAQKYVSNCDIILSNNKFIEPDIDESLEDVETSSGFHSNCSSNTDYQRQTYDEYASNNLDSLESLKSPKLVLATRALTKKENKVNLSESSPFNNNHRNDNDYNRTVSGPSQSRSYSRSTNNCDNQCCNMRHILDKNPTRDWYCDPANIALACSYGIACVHQLASLDLFAVLSILFAVISFIAALFM